MSALKTYVNYLNILLGVIALIVLIVLLIRLSKIKDTLNIINDDTAVLSSDIDKASKAIDSIKATEKSWSFFVSLYIIFVIIRETLKYRKSEKTIPRSFARSVTRHAKQLSSIRL